MIERTSTGPGDRLTARLCRVVVLAMALALPAGVAQAVEFESLYTVEVPYDPNQPGAQATAYRDALTQVLVRVTGTTAAAQSEELAERFPNPGRYVLSYRTGERDTYVVTLDGEAIERELRAFGATIWGSERPLTILWLAVDRGLGDREIVAAVDERVPAFRRPLDRNRLLRERLEETATYRGLPIVYPALDATDLELVSFPDIWGGFDERLMLASQRYSAPSILVGRIRPETGQYRWTWYFNNGRQDFNGEPEEVINGVADALAAQFSFGGSEPVESIRLTITGIDSVNAYGAVQRFLQSLRILDELQVESAAGDRITYRVVVQGGIERLQRALAQSTVLEREDIMMDRVDRRPPQPRDFEFDTDPFPSPLPMTPDALEYRYVPAQ